MWKLLGRLAGGSIANYVFAAAGVILAGLLVVAWAKAVAWRKADIARWTEAGRQSCQSRVDAAYQEGMRRLLARQAAAEAERQAIQAETERQRRAAAERVFALRSEIDGQVREIESLRLACTAKDGTEARVPLSVIEILNRR